MEGLPADLSTFQKLIRCIRGYCLLSTAEGYGRDANQLRSMLHFEEAHLAMWAECSGILRDSPERPLEGNQTVQTTLLKIATLLNVGHQMARLFKLRWVAVESPPERGVPLDNVPAVHLRYVRKKHIEVLEHAGFLQQGGHLSNRLYWTALNKPSFEKLVQKLADYNSRLYNALGKIQQTRMRQKFRIFELLLVSMSKNIHEVYDFYSALAVAHDSERTVRQLSRVKGLRMSNSAPDRGEMQLLQLMGTPLKAPPLHRQFPDLDLHNAKVAPSLARYEGRLVYLEWKPYNVLARKPDNPAVFQRIKDLAALLYASNDSTLPILNCRGYIEDVVRARYCFVFDFSTQDLPFLKPSPPCTLFELFNSPYTPNVSARLSLARTLAKCVLELQVVDWLHKGIRSENILFFSFTSALPSLDKPYLCGFEYGSQDTMAVIRDPFSLKGHHNFHEHLKRQMNGQWSNFRFSREYDVYSLGIVLVEIAQWKSMGDVVDTPEEVILKDVESRMGALYARAVQRCLQGAPQAAGKEHHLRSFFEEVVLHLDRIVV